MQLNQFYQRPQFPQAMSSRLQMFIKNPAKYLRWNV